MWIKCTATTLLSTLGRSLLMLESRYTLQGRKVRREMQGIAPVIHKTHVVSDESKLVNNEMGLRTHIHGSILQCVITLAKTTLSCQQKKTQSTAL